MCPWPQVVRSTWVTSFGDLHAWQSPLALSSCLHLRSAESRDESCQSLPSATLMLWFRAMEGGIIRGSFNKTWDRLKMHRVTSHEDWAAHSATYDFTLPAFSRSLGPHAHLFPAQVLFIVPHEVSNLVSSLGVNLTTPLCQADSENLDKGVEANTETLPESFHTHGNANWLWNSSAGCLR